MEGKFCEINDNDELKIRKLVMNKISCSAFCIRATNKNLNGLDL